MADRRVIVSERDPAKLREIAEQWLACFERRDLDALLALSSTTVSFDSPSNETSDPLHRSRRERARVTLVHANDHRTRSSP
jgi:hypothetical protein